MKFEANLLQSSSQSREATGSERHLEKLSDAKRGFGFAYLLNAMDVNGHSRLQY
jgi:hypothetical protein